MDDGRWESAGRYPYPIVHRPSSIVHKMTSVQNTKPNNPSLPVREVAIYWAPAVLWMLAIFYLSAQSALGEMDGPPAWMVARKCGHIFEYAALALLLGRALLYTWRTRGSALNSFWILDFGFWTGGSSSKSKIQNPKSKIERALLSRAWAVGVVLAALYAMTDEFHQTFVPKRGGRVEDVVLDTLSAVAALGFWYRQKARQLESRGPGPGDPERNTIER